MEKDPQVSEPGLSSSSSLWIHDVRMNQMPEPGCSLCLAVSMSAHCQPWKGPGFGMAEERGWEGPFDPKSLRAVGAARLLLAGDPSFTFYFPFPCVKRALFCIPCAGLVLGAGLGTLSSPRAAPGPFPAAQPRLPRSHSRFPARSAPVPAQPGLRSPRCRGASAVPEASGQPARTSCSSTSIGFGAGRIPGIIPELSCWAVRALPLCCSQPRSHRNYGNL